MHHLCHRQSRRTAYRLQARTASMGHSLANGHTKLWGMPFDGSISNTICDKQTKWTEIVNYVLCTRHYYYYYYYKARTFTTTVRRKNILKTSKRVCTSVIVSHLQRIKHCMITHGNLNPEPLCSAFSHAARLFYLVNHVETVAAYQCNEAPRRLVIEKLQTVAFQIQHGTNENKQQRKGKSAGVVRRPKYPYLKTRQKPTSWQKFTTDILSSTLVCSCQTDLMAVDRLLNLLVHRFLCFSSIFFCFSYSYVRQTRLASSLVNFLAHNNIVFVLIWFAHVFITEHSEKFTLSR